MNRFLTLIAFFQLQGICWAEPTLVLQPQQVSSCTPLLENNGWHAGYAEALANFNDTSLRILVPWISFTPDEIVTTTNILSNAVNYEHNQITYSLAADGSLEKVPVWLGDNTGLPSSVLAKLQIFATDLEKIYLLVKGHPAKQLGLSIRITSDRVGQSITRNYGGDFKDGLHNHLPPPGSRLQRKRNSIDFVWAIEGFGPRILKEGTIATAAENTISFMGIEVMHGSPPSEKLRFIIVGSISE